MSGSISSANKSIYNGASPLTPLGIENYDTTVCQSANMSLDSATAVQLFQHDNVIMPLHLVAHLYLLLQSLTQPPPPPLDLKKKKKNHQPFKSSLGQGAEVLVSILV